MRGLMYESKLSDLSHAARLLGHRTRRGLTKYTLRARTHYRQNRGKRSPHTLPQPDPTTVTLSIPQEPALSPSAWHFNIKL